MKNLLLICSFPLLLISCSRKEEVRDDVLPEKKMQVVLYDLMRVDQFLAGFVFSHDTSLNKRVESIKLYKRVFETHQVSRDDFQKSMTFYRSHPELFKVLLDSVSALALRRPSVPAVVPVTPSPSARDSGVPKRKLRPAKIN